MRSQATRPRSVPGLRLGAGPRRVAVFDLDGTLVDTAPDLTASLNHCLARAGLPPLDVGIVRPHAGKGVRAMLELGYARSGATPSCPEIDEQAAAFLAYYEAHIADRSSLFPGALAAMERLAGAGYALAVCTNKLEALSRRLLDALGLSAHFTAICGADTFGRGKPDPVHLLGTIERAGGEARASVMIGDTSVDMEAGAAALVPSVLVDFGYGADADAHRAADRVVSSFEAIDAALLDELIEARLFAG